MLTKIQPLKVGMGKDVSFLLNSYIPQLTDYSKKLPLTLTNKIQ